MNTLVKDLRSKYIKALRGLIEVAPYEKDTALVSVPLHISSYARVEFVVRQIGKNLYLISDNARTIGELEETGYKVSEKVREKMRSITKIWNVDLTGDTLSRTCSEDELGDVLHQFAETAKTIGDAFLAFPSQPSPKKDPAELRAALRDTLKQDFKVKEGHVVPGKLERHRVDFYIQPNGNKGLALAVLADPDRLHAEAWGFRALDIKGADNNMLVGIVYDAEGTKANSRTVIQAVADIPLASNELGLLTERMHALGVSTHHQEK